MTLSRIDGEQLNFAGAIIGAVGDISKAGLSLGESKKRIETAKLSTEQRKKELEEQYRRAQILLKAQAKSGEAELVQRKEVAVSAAKKKRLIIASTIFLTAIITSGVVAFLIIRKRKG